MTTELRDSVFDIIRDLLDQQIDAITYFERDDRSLNMGQDTKIIELAIAKTEDEILSLIEAVCMEARLDELKSLPVTEDDLGWAVGGEVIEARKTELLRLIGKDGK